ncbi:hypothetical protein CK203_081559 [Vitis vinifera]|uniref:Uncharacterized protein n=1 Tax=Vitis vinifera TaxID=29760 RepID=A0A438E2G4_VITVI|nr:hypothetical protein CK203_081559 [Vitis vinifera]
MANKTIGGSRIRPFDNYVDRQGREASTLAPSVGNFHFDSVTSKDGHTFPKSFSSERLREENVVLRIQASTSGPPRRQHSKGQVANSRPQQEPEPIYPGTTRAILGACNVRPHEPHTPMPELPVRKAHTLLTFQRKDNATEDSQLSNSMRARLGPQEPGRPRPPVATTWASRPDPMITPMGVERAPAS